MFCEKYDLETCTVHEGDSVCYILQHVLLPKFNFCCKYVKNANY